MFSFLNSIERLYSFCLEINQFICSAQTNLFYRCRHLLLLLTSNFVLRNPPVFVSIPVKNTINQNISFFVDYFKSFWTVLFFAGNECWSVTSFDSNGQWADADAVDLYSFLINLQHHMYLVNQSLRAVWIFQ